jgi:enamine deaminase RidA (YjgF/YER057c/UK114 family)
VYAGTEGRGVTAYWERMTAVRLRYIADPGPAATALRVSGVPGGGNLIGVDGIATLSPDRQRIMPAHSWDWSIPVPLSQGWRIANKIYVGGQISADRKGRTISIDDVVSQARNALEYIRHILLEGGQSWSDVVSLRVCFKHSGDAVAGRTLLASIMDVIRRSIPEPRPSLTALGVDLLYEGLLLEIDAVGISGGKQTVALPGNSDAETAFAGFPAACVAGNELYVGGLFGQCGAALQAQVEFSLQRLVAVVKASGFDPSELVGVSLFVVPADTAAQARIDHAAIIELSAKYLPPPRPVMTVVSLPALPLHGQRFQLDGVAVRAGDRISFFDSQRVAT